LLENTTPSNKGFIFGFYRAFDSAGAVGGSLLGLLLLYLLHENMRLIFLIALFPTVVAVFLLFLIKEKKSAVKPTEKKYVKIVWKNIDPQLKIFAISSLIFALGNSADAFLILRAKDLGLSTTFAVFAYVLYNIFQTIFATPGGSLADKIGAKRVYIYGLLIFAVVYFAFGIIHNPIWLWLIFPLYGIYISFTDGVSKSYIGGFIKKEESGSYFGAYYTLIGVANFFASFIGGWLWTRVNPSATLYFGSIMAVAGLLIFLVSKKSAVRS
jgi:MFS family permease